MEVCDGGGEQRARWGEGIGGSRRTPFGTRWANKGVGRTRLAGRTKQPNIRPCHWCSVAAHAVRQRNTACRGTGVSLLGRCADWVWRIGRRSIAGIKCNQKYDRGFGDTRSRAPSTPHSRLSVHHPALAILGVHSFSGFTVSNPLLQDLSLLGQKSLVIFSHSLHIFSSVSSSRRFDKTHPIYRLALDDIHHRRPHTLTFPRRTQTTAKRSTRERQTWALSVFDIHSLT